MNEIFCCQGMSQLPTSVKTVFIENVLVSKCRNIGMSKRQNVKMPKYRNVKMPKTLKHRKICGFYCRHHHNMKLS
jgi:hypothetical protein